jgi:hypothetical protein
MDKVHKHNSFNNNETVSCKIYVDRKYAEKMSVATMFSKEKVSTQINLNSSHFYSVSELSFNIHLHKLSRPYVLPGMFIKL